MKHSPVLRRPAVLGVVLLAAFAALFLLSWPTVFSFALWVLYDRGNLLNVDYLMADGMRPGIDFFYSYGLLPLAVQRAAFALGGRGYAPMLAITVIAMPPMALIWAALFRRLPPSWPWLLAVLCVVPMLLWVNPNLPYTLVLLSMLGALALVAAGRLPWALAAAAVGCWSVPSLPLVLSALLAALIIIDWWTAPGRRSGAALLRMLLPGALTWAGTGAALALLFGWAPVAATALPFAGAHFYAEKGYGWANLHEFLSPAGAGLRWYLFTRSGWWMASTVLLFGLAAWRLAVMLRARAVDPAGAVVALLAALHAAFVFVAPGPQAQHLIYDPLLAGGVLLGLALLPRGAARGALLAGYCALALTGSAWQVRDTWRSWRDEVPRPETAGLYATADFAAHWRKLLDLAARRDVLMLTYATGVHHYFPAVHGPRIWVLEVGQLLPQDEARVIAQIKAAQTVATYPDSPYLARDATMRAALGRAMCPIGSDAFLTIWQRRGPDGACPSPIASPIASAAPG